MHEPAPLPISQLGLARIEERKCVVVRIVVDLGVRQTDLGDVRFVLFGLLGLLSLSALGDGDLFLLHRHGALLIGFYLLLLGDAFLRHRLFLILFGDGSLLIGFYLLLLGDAFLRHRLFLILFSDRSLIVGFHLFLLGDAALGLRILACRNRLAACDVDQDQSGGNRHNDPSDERRNGHLRQPQPALPCIALLAGLVDPRHQGLVFGMAVVQERRRQVQVTFFESTCRVVSLRFGQQQTSPMIIVP